MSDPNATHHVLLCDDKDSPFCYDQNLAAFKLWVKNNTPAVQLTGTQPLFEFGIVTIIAGDVDATLLGTCPVVEAVNPNRL